MFQIVGTFQSLCSVTKVPIQGFSFSKSVEFICSVVSSLVVFTTFKIKKPRFWTGLDESLHYSVKCFTIQQDGKDF